MQNWSVDILHKHFQTTNQAAIERLYNPRKTLKAADNYPPNSSKDTRMAGKKGMKHAQRLDDSSIDRIRYRILQSKIANRLMDHVNGELEMSNSQVNAAMGLLRKVMPDLSATELSGNITHFSEALERIAKQRHAAPLLTDRSVIEQPGDSVIH